MRAHTHALRLKPALSAALALAVGAAIALAQEAPNPLALPGTQQTQPATLAPFPNLPTPKSLPADPTLKRGTGVHPGTDGLDLPGLRIPNGQGLTLAILSDLAPTNSASPKYLASAIAQLNLLHPDLVLTTGNLVPGLTRDVKTYTDELLSTHDALDALKMPWFPCIGQTDVISGTRIPGTVGLPTSGDRRFEQLYKRSLGPLYYSLDAGDLHVIVLDTEEGVGSGTTITNDQLRWLKGDLNRTFESGSTSADKTRWVIVLAHRPLWRINSAEPKGATTATWDQVHALLVDFNRRPIVTFEGSGGPDELQATGPRVVAVFAGSERAYSLEPTRDGIHYYVLGPSAAAPHPGESTAEAIRHFTLIKFDRTTGPAASAAAMHIALIQLDDAATPGTPIGTHILPEDILSARERAILDSIAAWGDDIIGIDGTIEPPPPNPPAPPAPTTSQPATTSAPAAAPLKTPPPQKLTLRLSNPLSDPIDIQLRLASTRFLDSAPSRELSNPALEGYDSPFDLNAAHVIRHLAPGAKDSFSLALTRSEDDHRASPPPSDPPLLEILVHWTDPRGRSHEIILKRRLPVLSPIKIPAATETVRLNSDDGWSHAAEGSLFAWHIRGDEPSKLNPLWQMTADADNLCLRLRVQDSTPSYFPPITLANGPLLSDAISLAWTHALSPNQPPLRLYLLPFAPNGPELWTNTGPADKQSPLLRLDPKSGITALVQRRPDGYTATLTLPKKLLTPDPANPLLFNLSLLDNDQRLQTFTRSLAPESTWSKVEFLRKQTP